MRNIRAALKQVRIRNSGHILARRAAAELKASRCALLPLVLVHCCHCSALVIAFTSCALQRVPVSAVHVVAVC